MDDERTLDTLADAWHQAIRVRTTCPDEQREWWEGFVGGLAVAITVVSGLPNGGINLRPAIRTGCEIARAHGTR